MVGEYGPWSECANCADGPWPKSFVTVQFSARSRTSQLSDKKTFLFFLIFLFLFIFNLFHFFGGEVGGWVGEWVGGTRYQENTDHLSPYQSSKLFSQLFQDINTVILFFAIFSHKRNNN